MHFNRMMDALPEPLASYEQVITQKLVGCGLSPHGLSVSYDDDLQSHEIVIGPSANATPEMFTCIRAAVAGEMVTFDDPELTDKYYMFVTEALRPQLIESAEAALAKRGLLKGLPRRADFASDTLFAEAMEDHCGLAKGEALQTLGDSLVFQPVPDPRRDFQAAMKRYSCLLAAMQLAVTRGEVKFGFVGNEAVAAPD